jgi:hypothetical protein
VRRIPDVLPAQVGIVGIYLKVTGLKQEELALHVEAPVDRPFARFD